MRDWRTTRRPRWTQDHRPDVGDAQRARQQSRSTSSAAIARADQRNAAPDGRRPGQQEPAHDRPGDRRHFPDMPMKQLRYSAAIRERGGIGYYPTSAIPFVHVDTGPRARLAAAAAQRAGAAVPQRQDQASAGRRRIRSRMDDVRKRARQHGGRHAGRRLLRAPQSSQVADRDRRGRGRRRAARAVLKAAADAGCVAGAGDTRRRSRTRSLRGIAHRSAGPAAGASAAPGNTATLRTPSAAVSITS